jgi:hypothetical protein
LPKRATSAVCARCHAYWRRKWSQGEDDLADREEGDLALRESGAPYGARAPQEAGWRLQTWDHATQRYLTSAWFETEAEARAMLPAYLGVWKAAGNGGGMPQVEACGGVYEGLALRESGAPYGAEVLRWTTGFIAREVPGGGGAVRITARGGALPRSRTVSAATWRELELYGDATFDAACVLDLGIGVWRATANEAVEALRDGPAAAPPRASQPHEVGGARVETWGGGRYGTVAWYASAEEAEAYAGWLVRCGIWRVKPPRVVVDDD